MSYKNLIDKSLRIAFLNLKDLAIDITIESFVTTFDFNSGETANKGTKISVKAVNISNKKGKQNDSSKDLTDIKEVEFMLKRPSSFDIKIGDVIIENSSKYTVARIVKDDGYISIVQAVKI